MESDAQNAKTKAKKCGVSSLGQVEYNFRKLSEFDVNVESSNASRPVLMGEMS
jgi:HKD family nuclease